MAADGGPDRGGLPGPALTCSLAAGSVSITPDRSLPLAGFTDRLEPSTAVADPLELNALLLRTSQDTIAILTADLLFVTADVKRRIAERLRPELALDDASFLLAASHTHFAPSVDPSKPRLGPADPAYVDLVIARGAELLSRLAGRRSDQGVTVVEYRNGLAAHAINRRRMGWRLSPRAPHLPRRAALRAPNAKGPCDETVHVVTLVGSSGRPAVVLWSYACHPVSFAEPRQVSADFPGVVRRALRTAFGNDVPVLFLQGCAGDIRPRELGRARSLRRRLAELVVGKLFTSFTPAEYAAWSGSLAALVVNVARASGRAFPLPSAFRTAQASIPLSDLLDGVAPGNRSLTLQRIELAPGLAIAAMSAEPAVEYGLALRAAEPAGQIAIPCGYSDTVFGYLPTARMLGQHGYEDEGFMEAFGLSGRFRPQLEQVVGSAWRQLRGT